MKKWRDKKTRHFFCLNEKKSTFECLKEVAVDDNLTSVNWSANG